MYSNSAEFNTKMDFMINSAELLYIISFFKQNGKFINIFWLLNKVVFEFFLQKNGQFLKISILIGKFDVNYNV